jgi:3-hydroxyisobutyrate dehydrogenase-like beta-hydroxyacid dehydrogenase
MAFAGDDDPSAVSVKVELAAALFAKFTETGAKAQDTPIRAGVEHVNATELLILLSGARVNVAVACWPTVSGPNEELALMEK